MVRAQVALNQYDLFCVGKVHVGEFLEPLRVIDRGALVGYFDFAPSLRRSEHHEQVGDAVAHVLELVPDRSSWLGRVRLAGLDDQFFGDFIETNQGPLGISRLLVGFQHVFHGGGEGRVGVRWDHPLPIAVWLKRVFSVRTIV